MDFFMTTNRVVEWKTVHLIQSCKDLEIFWYFVVSKGLCLQLPSRTAKQSLSSRHAETEEWINIKESWSEIL